MVYCKGMKPTRCSDCNTERKWLHKHHLKLQSSGGTDADGVVYLCANCHEDRHGGPCGGQGRGRLAHSKAAQIKRAQTLKLLWSDPKYRAKQIRSRKHAWKTRDRSAQAQVMANIWTPTKRRQHSAMMTKIQRKRIKLGLLNPTSLKAKRLLKAELTKAWK